MSERNASAAGLLWNPGPYWGMTEASCWLSDSFLPLQGKGGKEGRKWKRGSARRDRKQTQPHEHTSTIWVCSPLSFFPFGPPARMISQPAVLVDQQESHWKIIHLPLYQGFGGITGGWTLCRRLSVVFMATQVRVPFHIPQKRAKKEPKPVNYTIIGIPNSRADINKAVVLYPHSQSFNSVVEKDTRLSRQMLNDLE